MGVSCQSCSAWSNSIVTYHTGLVVAEAELSDLGYSFWQQVKLQWAAVLCDWRNLQGRSQLTQQAAAFEFVSEVHY